MNVNAELHILNVNAELIKVIRHAEVIFEFLSTSLTHLQAQDLQTCVQSSIALQLEIRMFSTDLEQIYNDVKQQPWYHFGTRFTTSSRYNTVEGWLTNKKDQKGGALLALFAQQIQQCKGGHLFGECLSAADIAAFAFICILRVEIPNLFEYFPQFPVFCESLAERYPAIRTSKQLQALLQLTPANLQQQKPPNNCKPNSK